MIYIKLLFFFTGYINGLLRYPKISMEVFQLQDGPIGQGTGPFTPFFNFSYFIYLCLAYTIFNDK